MFNLTKMDPISSSGSDFGRDEDLEVDTHLYKPSNKRVTIYEKAMNISKKENKDPIVWPSGSRTLNANNNRVLFGNTVNTNTNINFNAIDFLLQEKLDKNDVTKLKEL